MIGDEGQLETHASLLIRLRQEPTDQRAWEEFAQRYGRPIWPGAGNGDCRRRMPTT